MNYSCLRYAVARVVRKRSSAQLSEHIACHRESALTIHYCLLAIGNNESYKRKLTDCMKFVREKRRSAILSGPKVAPAKQRQKQLETVSIAEPLQNRQHARLMLSTLEHKGKREG